MLAYVSCFGLDLSFCLKLSKMGTCDPSSGARTVLLWLDPSSRGSRTGVSVLAGNVSRLPGQWSDR